MPISILDTAPPGAPRGRRNGLLISGGLAAGLLLAVGVAASASAHVTVAPNTAPAGSSTILSFSFAHGCEPADGSTSPDSPTTRMVFTIPDSVDSVTPVVNPGWDVQVVRGPAAAATPGSTDGATPATTDPTHVSSVVFTAKTAIETGVRDTLALQVRVPDAAGQTLEFPVLQVCDEGETSWDQATPPGGAEPDHPAPFITVTAADASADGSTDASAAGQSAGVDWLARGLGIAGLVVGAVGITLAVLARPRRAAKASAGDDAGGAPE